MTRPRFILWDAGALVDFTDLELAELLESDDTAEAPLTPEQRAFQDERARFESERREFDREREWLETLRRMVRILKQDRAEALTRNPAIPSAGESMRPYRALSEAMRPGPPLSAFARGWLEQMQDRFDPVVVAIRGATSVDPAERDPAIDRLIGYCGWRHPDMKAALISAADTVRTPQTFRPGRKWVKTGGRLVSDGAGNVVREGGSLATVVPLEAFDVWLLVRWLRAKAYAWLPSHPHRQTRKDGPHRRELPAGGRPSAVEVAGVEPSAEVLIASRQALALLASCAARGEMDVLRLRLEGCSTAEAARRLGIRPGAARKRMWSLRGRPLPRKVRDALTEAEVTL